MGAIKILGIVSCIQSKEDRIMKAIIFRRRDYIKHNPSSNTNTLLQVLTMLAGGTKD